MLITNRKPKIVAKFQLDQGQIKKKPLMGQFFKELQCNRHTDTQKRQTLFCVFWVKKNLNRYHEKW